uniref:PKD domain-containing protein n=1 Tax=Crocinitomix catalasitica TaxID=184607 RepID=UPI00056ADEAD
NGIDDDGDGLVDLNDVEDCECVSLIGSSLIPNPSFEDTICCPEYYGGMRCAETWIQASDPTPDFFHTCGLMFVDWVITMPEMPIPRGGDGFIGFFTNTRTWSEYIGACLDVPLISGTSYVLNFYTAYGEGPDVSELALYGASTCDDLPWFGTNCPDGIGTWELLGDIEVTYEMDGTWQEVTMIFTPDINVYAISIGGPCIVGGEGFSDYYFIDELILVDSSDFFNITSTGGWCSEDLILFGEADEPGGTWQWYKDGIALLEETDITFEPLLYGQGEFSAVYTNFGSCSRYNYFSPAIFEVEIELDSRPCFSNFVTFFNNTSLIYGEPEEWIWSLGDGVISTEDELSHTYTDPGTYEVALIGISTDESCIDTATYEFIVYDNPNAEYEIESETTFLFWGSIASCTKQE